MKTLITAAVSVCVLAGAAAASASPRHSGPAASAQSSSACTIYTTRLGLGARAAPAGAASWSLDVRAPGFVAEQGGPLTGGSSRLQTLSQVYLPYGRPPASQRNRDADNRRLAHQTRPIHAHLQVFDAQGRVTCQDTLRLTPGR